MRFKWNRGLHPVVGDERLERRMLPLAAAGIAMGLVGVFGATDGRPLVETAMWLVIAAAWAAVGIMAGARRPVATFTVVGLLNGALHALAYAVFWSTYVANNPSFVEQAQGQDVESAPIRLFSAVVSLVSGTLLGLLAGLAVAGARRIRRRT